MFSLKTLTQALLVASIATSSLAAVVPDRYARHAARLLSAALGEDTADFVKETASQELVKAGLEKAVTKIQDQFNGNTDNTVVAADAPAVTARAIPGLTPELEDLIKSSAVAGLAGGATTAAINGITNLFENKQTRGVSTLSDDDLQLLSILSRRMLEVLD